MEKANRALGRLDGVATLLPDTSLFIYFFVRKEAVLSSQIEGTQSSIADLLLYENAESPGTPLEDVEEVSSYVAALRFGLQRLNEGFPISLRLLREVHLVLLSTGRGSSKLPWRVPTITKLDWWHATWQRTFCSSSTREADGEALFVAGEPNIGVF